MKKSALKAMKRNTPIRNAWLAMLGPCIAVPHGDRMAKLVCYCASARQKRIPLPNKREQKAFRAAQLVNLRRERLMKRRVAPLLVALFWDALADSNPAPLEQCAAIMRRIREHNEAAAQGNTRHSLPLEEKIFRIADVARMEGKPLTGREVLKRIGVNKEHDDSSRERKALNLAGKMLVPDKRGRPAKMGSRKR